MIALQKSRRRPDKRHPGIFLQSEAKNSGKVRENQKKPACHKVFVLHQRSDDV